MDQEDIICKTQSPIERMMVEALLVALDEKHSDMICIQTQARLGPYSADIMVFEDGGFPLLVVECDGHDFHDRTKEQAAKDRRRDRWILETYDVTTVRFTGSEIYADAHGCADYCVSVAYYVAYKNALMRKGDQFEAGKEAA